MSKNTTIAYSKDFEAKLNSFCLANGIKKGEFVVESLLFFERYGINPTEALDNINSNIKKSENRIISFIKTQDKNNLRFERSMYERLETLENFVSEQTKTIGVGFTNIVKNL